MKSFKCVTTVFFHYYWLVEFRMPPSSFVKYFVSYNVQIALVLVPSIVSVEADYINIPRLKKKEEKTGSGVTIY